LCRRLLSQPRSASLEFFRAWLGGRIFAGCRAVGSTGQPITPVTERVKQLQPAAGWSGQRSACPEFSRLSRRSVSGRRIACPEFSLRVGNPSTGLVAMQPKPFGKHGVNFPCYLGNRIRSSIQQRWLVTECDMIISPALAFPPSR
jgi:hypothetical protein